MDIQDNATEQIKMAQSFEAFQEIASQYLATGDYAQAQLHYENAAVLWPDESEPYVGLGTVALQNDLLDDAKLAFRVACRLNRDCAKAYAGLAMIAQKKSDYEEAFDMYLKCLELDTDNLSALLGLFQTSCQMGSFARVIHYLEIYRGMHPEDASVMFSLAALYMKEDRMEKSKEMLLDILRLYPSNTEAVNLLEEVEHNLAHLKPSGV